MLNYETLLDLARQRLATISQSPNHTRDARHTALRLLREVETEIDALAKGHPFRRIVDVGEKVDGLMALGLAAKEVAEAIS